MTPAKAMLIPEKPNPSVVSEYFLMKVRSNKAIIGGRKIKIKISSLLKEAVLLLDSAKVYISKKIITKTDKFPKRCQKL